MVVRAWVEVVSWTRLGPILRINGGGPPEAKEFNPDTSKNYEIWCETPQ